VKRELPANVSALRVRVDWFWRSNRRASSLNCPRRGRRLVAPSIPHYHRRRMLRPFVPAPSACHDIRPDMRGNFCSPHNAGRRSTPRIGGYLRSPQSSRADHGALLSCPASAASIIGHCRDREGSRPKSRTMIAKDGHWRFSDQVKQAVFRTQSGTTDPVHILF
jgi:hypothetical protein